MANEPVGDKSEKTDEALEYLRGAVSQAGSSPVAMGWQTEGWLSHREQMLQDVRDLLTPESIAAEMRIRTDVPRLLAQLAATLRAEPAQM